MFEKFFVGGPRASRRSSQTFRTKKKQKEIKETFVTFGRGHGAAHLFERKSGPRDTCRFDMVMAKCGEERRTVGPKRFVERQSTE
jgi:hypothetical protein